MFFGVIKNNSRKILKECFEEKKFKNYAIGCCGAFTIENILASNFQISSITSCDVSIFTNAVGFYLSDQDYDISIDHEELDFLNEYFKSTPVKKTAALLFLSDIGRFISRRNLYLSRMTDSMIYESKSLLDGRVR